MARKEKLLRKLTGGSRNVRFSEFQSALILFGFRLDRISGSHHIYVRRGITELINIQNVKGYAKPYQIKQFLALVERHNLHVED